MRRNEKKDSSDFRTEVAAVVQVMVKKVIMKSTVVVKLMEVSLMVYLRFV